MKFSHVHGLHLVLLTVFFVGTACAQTRPPNPIKISLEHICHPQFSSGFWVSTADPHFRHAADTLFWLSADEVATTFFKEYCCKSGGKSGVRYGAAVFDLGGKLIAQHEWTSMSDAPFLVRGAVGAFWLRYADKIEVLRADFTVAEQIPVSKGSFVVWSKSGHGVAMQDGTTLSIYDYGNGTTANHVTIPAETRAADVNGSLALLTATSRATSCSITVVEPPSQIRWTPVLNAAKVDNLCPSGIGLLSADAVLIAEPRMSGLEYTLKIARRNGGLSEVSSHGSLLEIVTSSRLAFQSFDPNPFAHALDMDFGGHKKFTVYDLGGNTIIFKARRSGQAGASLSPDGHHLALIDGDKLLIYALP